MPRVVVVEQKFLAKLNNGDDFTTNETTDFAVHLKGGVLEEIKAVFKIQVSWAIKVEGNTATYLYDNSAQTFRYQISGQDFESEGFSVGDEYRISDINWTIWGVISSISIGEVNMTITSSDLLPSPNTIVTASQTQYFTGTTNKTALKYDFGLIENSEPINFLSKLTNTNLTYLFEGIDHNNPLTFVDGLSQGNNKAGYSGSAKVAFVGYSAGIDARRVTENLTDAQEFQVEHTFKINPFYRDGELDSLQGSDVPPLDIFNGDRSLKYVFQSEFRTVLNNPNTSMISSYDTQEGSVGYLDESFNGYASDFSVSDLVYTNLDTGLIVDRLDVGAKVRVGFNLKSADGVFALGMPLIVGHTSVVDSLVYSNSTEVYQDVWLDEDIRRLEGEAPLDGDIIKAYSSTFVDVNTLSVTFDVEFDDTQKRNKLSDNQDYLLYYTVSDPTKTVDEGSKVTGRIDVNIYNKSNDIAGLFDVETFDQYPVPLAFDKGVSTGVTFGKMFIEDEQFCYARIKVLNEYLGEDGNLLEDVTLSALKFKIVAYNTVENTWFDVRSLDIDLSDQIVSGNIQSIELDTTRGYTLTDVDIFNSLKLTTDTNDGTWQYYDLEIGYKIPWQSWLKLEGADTIFLDRTKEQSGLNQNISNYSFTNDYKVKFLIDADVETVGITTNYVKRTGNFEAYNYNTDDQEPDAYTCDTSTFKADGTPILGNVIQKGFTEVRGIFTPLVDPIFTESVNMEDVSTVYDPVTAPLGWKRFSHGNRRVDINFPRLPNWFNFQADDVDTFTGFAQTPTVTKNSVTYTSTPTTIEAVDNLNAIYGCYSVEEYEFYSISGTVFSLGGDDDIMIYDIAFNVDEFGIESKISMVCSAGGIGLEIAAAYDPNDDTTDILGLPRPYEEFVNIGILYNYGKDDTEILARWISTEPRAGWNTIGECNFDIRRSSKDIEIDIDWTINGTPYSPSFNIDLNDNPKTVKLNGFQNIGFSFLSQDQGGFKNVDLTLPTGNYYGVIRMETKNSPSDSGISELNTEVVNTEDSLLKQITGAENKASLSFDGTNFIVQGSVRTDNITEGEDYKISSEIRLKDLKV